MPDRDPNELLEERLRSASQYVRPSEFFRARVLGDARQWQTDETADRALLRTVLAVACSIALSLASLHSVQAWWEERLDGWSSEAMHVRAERIASEQGLSFDASLAEAFRESREDLAARWAHRDTSAKP
jgi:hypothetical protein